MKKSGEQVIEELEKRIAKLEGQMVTKANVSHYHKPSDVR